jgi:hypothetical protein
MKSFRSKDGSVTLEAAIILPIFIFIFLSIFGLFGMINARQEITRAMVQVGKSMSLDPYATEMLEKSSDTRFRQVEQIIMNQVRKAASQEKYSDITRWYSGGNPSEVARNRFIGYFAGGDEDLADEKLKWMGVEGGLGGLDIKGEVSGNELTITTEYKLKFLFDFIQAGDLGQVKTTSTHWLWKH